MIGGDVTWVMQNTWNAIKDLGPNLAHVSKERIQMELTKLLLSAHPQEIKNVFTCGLEGYVSDTFSHIQPKEIHIPAEIPALGGFFEKSGADTSGSDFKRAENGS